MTFPRNIASPSFSTALMPGLPLVQLTEDERQIIARLQSSLRQQCTMMELNEAYYLGEQRMTNLGIALPKELQTLRTVVGWPARAVDPVARLLNAVGFRLRGATDDDQDLWDLWDANNGPAEQSLLYTDGLSLGSGWWTVGAGDAKGDPAMIRVESPMNMVAEWDPRTLQPKNVLQQYWANQSWHAVLYTPSESVFMDADEQNSWRVVDRQPHNLGRPLVVRGANRPRTRARDGASEITAAVRNITDWACRDLLNLGVAGEMFAAPRRYILGASEADFQKSDGTAKTGWETYMTTMLALERDEDGNTPTVGEFRSYDPSVFTKVLDFRAAQMASEIDGTPQELGLYTEGNPPSADGAQFAARGRILRAKEKQRQFGAAHIEALRLGVMVQNGGVLPPDMQHIEVDWEDPAFMSFPAAANAIAQLAAAEVLPPASDVTLGLIGLSPVQRARVEQDRKAQQGSQVLAEIQQRLAKVNSVGNDSTEPTAAAQ